MADTPKRSRRQGRGSHLNSWAKETTESQGFCHSPWPLRIAWVEPLLWFLTHPNIKSRSPAPLTAQSAHQCPPGWGRSTRGKHPGQWCHGQAGRGRPVKAKSGAHCSEQGPKEEKGRCTLGNAGAPSLLLPWPCRCFHRSLWEAPCRPVEGEEPGRHGEANVSFHTEACPTGSAWKTSPQDGREAAQSGYSREIVHLGTVTAASKASHQQALADARAVPRVSGSGS